MDRQWASIDHEEQGGYTPQVGDLVTYLFQAHEEFIIAYFDFLRFSKKEIFPFDKRNWLLKDNICKITHIKYQFPFCPKRCRVDLNILMKVTMEVIEAEGIESLTLEEKTFSVSYFPGSLDFFIQRDVYLNSINMAKALPKESQIAVRCNGENKLGFFSEVSLG